MKRKISVLLMLALLATMVMSFVNVGATSSAPTIATSKVAYTEGENVVVNFSGFTEDLWASGQWTEIDLHKKGNVVGTHSPLKCHVIKATSASYEQSGKTEGTITFPTDDNYYGNTNWPLAAGEYYVCLRTGNNIVGEPAYFTVVDPDGPALELSKATYEEGEDIVVSFARFTEEYWGTGKWVEIDIHKEGNVVGKDACLMTHIIKATSASYEQSGLTEGTITFPEDDNYTQTLPWPLPVGKYYACLRVGNDVIGLTVPFEVVEADEDDGLLDDGDQEENKPTGDASVMLLVAMATVCAGAVVVAKKRSKCGE